MSQTQPRGEEWLKALLALNRNRPGFGEALRSLVGEAQEWTDEGEVYFTSKTAGVEILTNTNGDMAAVFLFGPESEEAPDYRGELPGGLHFGLSRDEVRSLLGDPYESGEPKLHLGDVLAPWDKYRLADYCLHARYALDGSHLVRVTVMPNESRAASMPRRLANEFQMASPALRWNRPERQLCAYLVKHRFPAIICLARANQCIPLYKDDGD